MRLEHPHRLERFGAVKLHGLQQVIELDSGGEQHQTNIAVQGRMVTHVPHSSITDIEGRMAIVVPCKDERRKVIEGVLSGIPHDCLIIVVSNSAREPVDRYEMELQTVEQFCDAAERAAVVVHQRDPGLSESLALAGFSSMLDDDGLTRNGKGEGMVVGMALAALAGRDFVGYIDADNYVPGAVHEYVKVFAAGLHLASSPYAMVRISWQSKPKVQDGRLFFNRWGRSSQLTNFVLNSLIAEYSGFGTDIVSTANAGEHALSMELGLRMRMAGGFAVEPFQFIDLFEQFGGVIPTDHADVMRSVVDIFQIETRNPHFHDNKGVDHVQEMRLQALHALYHSPVCPGSVKEEILGMLREQGNIRPDEEPGLQPIYPPLLTLDWEKFITTLVSSGRSFRQIQRRRVAGVVVEDPILRMEDEPGESMIDLSDVKADGIVERGTAS